MTIKAIAWDVDGTLADSEPLHHQALLAACLAEGLDLSGLDEQTYVGIGVDDVWAVLRPLLPVTLIKSDWLAAIDAHYFANRHTLAAMPGAIEAVTLAARLGLRQAAVSNSHRRVVETNIAALGLARHIEFCVCLDDVKHGKPAPEPYLKACAQFGLAPAEVLAIEDSVAGAISARAAGLLVLTVRPTASHATDTNLRSLAEIGDLMHQWQ